MTRLETKIRLEEGTLEKLKELVQCNVDSRDGFRELAKKTQDDGLSSMFRELSFVREEQAAQLRDILAANAESSSQQGSYSALAHRTWIDFRAAVGGGSLAMLQEAERGEELLKGKYEQVLRETAGSAVNDILQHQHAAVKAARDRIRAMREAQQNCK